MIQTGDLATPPLGTLFFRNEEAGSDFGPLMAGTVVITAPLVLLFLAAQRRFIPRSSRLYRFHASAAASARPSTMAVLSPSAARASWVAIQGDPI